MKSLNIEDMSGFDQDAIARMESVRRAFLALEKSLNGLLPESRESSIACTNLEQAAMWAIKSIRVEQVAQGKGSKVEL